VCQGSQGEDLGPRQSHQRGTRVSLKRAEAGRGASLLRVIGREDIHLRAAAATGELSEGPARPEGGQDQARLVRGLPDAVHALPTDATIVHVGHLTGAEGISHHHAREGTDRGRLDVIDDLQAIAQKVHTLATEIGDAEVPLY